MLKVDDDGIGAKSNPASKATQMKKRELTELRIRWKVADESAKRIVQERKDLKDKIAILAAELGMTKLMSESED